MIWWISGIIVTLTIAVFFCLLIAGADESRKKCSHSMKDNRQMMKTRKED